MAACGIVVAPSFWYAALPDGTREDLRMQEVFRAAQLDSRSDLEEMYPFPPEREDGNCYETSVDEDGGVWLPFTFRTREELQRLKAETRP